MSSELLDTYEEGSFTPTYNNGTVSYSAQNGFYIRVGNIVHCFFDLTVSSCSSQTGVPFIGGFPFNKHIRLGGTAYYYESVGWWHCDNSFTNSTAVAQGYMVNGTSNLNMYFGDTPQHGTGFVVNQTGRVSGTLSYTAQ